MALDRLEYSRGHVDKAGSLLASGTGTAEEIDLAMSVLGDWRSFHRFPLNTIQMGLRSKAHEICEEPLVAQRLKRASSTVVKLQRYPHMALSQMQDIGGCRAVVPGIDEAYRLRELFLCTRARHELANENDYIHTPKPSGYRGIHLIYKYQSDKNAIHNGLRIEVQLRSYIQHIWATALETVDTFMQSALKSSRGPEEWLRFFHLMGCFLACEEKSAPVPGMPAGKNVLLNEIAHLERTLGVRHILSGYTLAADSDIMPEAKGRSYYLLTLRPRERSLSIRAYYKRELSEATEYYLNAEKQLNPERGDQVVLVSVDSLKALRRSYPNYYFDTRMFVLSITKALRQRSKHKERTLATWARVRASRVGFGSGHWDSGGFEGHRPQCRPRKYRLRSVTPDYRLPRPAEDEARAKR